MIKLIGKGPQQHRLELDVHPTRVRLHDGSLPYIIQYEGRLFANSDPTNTHPSDKTGTVHYWESEAVNLTPEVPRHEQTHERSPNFSSERHCS
jgi:hypothetical protein